MEHHLINLHSVYLSARLIHLLPTYFSVQQYEKTQIELKISEQYLDKNGPHVGCPTHSRFPEYKLGWSGIARKRIVILSEQRKKN